MKTRRERLLLILLAVLCMYAITVKDTIAEAITTIFLNDNENVVVAAKPFGSNAVINSNKDKETTTTNKGTTTTNKGTTTTNKGTTTTNKGTTTTNKGESSSSECSHVEKYGSYAGWEANSEEHYVVCYHCGDTLRSGEHYWNDDDKCGACGYTKPSSNKECNHVEKYGSYAGWEATSKKHYVVCYHCGETLRSGKHYWGDDNKCGACGYPNPNASTTNNNTSSSSTTNNNTSNSSTTNKDETTSSTHTHKGVYDGGANAGWYADEDYHWVYCECGVSMTGVDSTRTGRVKHYEREGKIDGKCDACGYSMSTEDNHQCKGTVAGLYAGWMANEEKHWVECTCGQSMTSWEGTTKGRVQHNWNGGTSCTVCGYSKKDASTNVHVHTGEVMGTYSGWFADATGHYVLCSCGETMQALDSTLTGKRGHEYRDGACRWCGWKEGQTTGSTSIENSGTVDCVHSTLIFNTDQKYNGWFVSSQEHYFRCKGCGKDITYADPTWSTGKTLVVGRGSHTLNNSTGNCEYCNYSMSGQSAGNNLTGSNSAGNTSTHQCIISENYGKDANYHWKKCTNKNCNIRLNETSHEYDQTTRKCVCGKSHSHSSSSDWSTENGKHWKVCLICGGKYGERDCTYNSNGICTTCKVSKGDTSKENASEKDHKHEWNGEWSQYPEYHAQVCKCGEPIYTEPHDYDNGNRKCIVCDRPHDCIYPSEYTNGGDKHYKACTKCGKLVKRPHSYNDLGICTASGCGAVKLLEHTCTPSKSWSYDGTNHWKECSKLTCFNVVKGTKGAHDSKGANGGCSVCGKKIKSHVCEPIKTLGFFGPEIWFYDTVNNQHYQICKECQEEINRGDHDINETTGECVCGYHECKPDTTGKYKGYSANFSKHWQACIVKGCDTKFNEGTHVKIANAGCGTCGYGKKIKEYTVTIIPVYGSRPLSPSYSKCESGSKVTFTADAVRTYNMSEYEFVGWEVSGVSSSSSNTTIEFVMPANNVQLKQIYTLKK